MEQVFPRLVSLLSFPVGLAIYRLETQIFVLRNSGTKGLKMGRIDQKYAKN